MHEKLLDREGLKHFREQTKGGLVSQEEFDLLEDEKKKNGIYVIPGDNGGSFNPSKIVINGQTVELRSDGIPVQPITKDKYEQLTEDEKQKPVLYLVDERPWYSTTFQGKPVFGQRGPAGPDGNPIGAIISFMGLTAPTDYLICDGSLYKISDYPDLADFFEQQFGDKQYFGGEDGTFAVPDMRNLFLRGYHGDAEELSGDVGQRQDGTILTNLYTALDSNGTFAIAGMANSNPSGTNVVDHVDRVLSTSSKWGSASIAGSRAMSGNPYRFTSRPVNMAVLYCIKATKEEPYEDVYSEEEMVIGRWIDGRPLYRRVVEAVTPSSVSKWNPICGPIGDEGTIEVTTLSGVVYNQGIWQPIPYTSTIGVLISIRYYDDLGIQFYTTHNDYASAMIRVVIEYTKTTDPLPSTIADSKILTPMPTIF